MNNEIKNETWRPDGMEVELHLGDCVKIVSGMDSESIDYSIFSPPFLSLYVYSDNEYDMGNCKNDSQFYEQFKFLVGQLYRVLKPGRLLSFHCMNVPALKSKDGFIGLKDFRGELIKMFCDEGFIYHSEVCIWKDPVTQMQRTKSIGLLHKQIKKDSSMSRMGLPDYVVTMRKKGENPEPISHTDESFPVDRWQRYASPVWFDIDNKTLNYMGGRASQDERHIAPLQLDVIRRCLDLWSNPGDLVLSPFAGIGSEGYVCVETGRSFVGVELKKSYFDLAKKNLMDAGKQTNDLFMASSA
jgi:DNA modification methylase